MPKLPRSMFLALASLGLPMLASAQSLTVITIAGDVSQAGYLDGAGATARFSNPVALVVDPLGNVYLNDYNNATIRKVSPSGVVSTLAGAAGSKGYADGPGNVARFFQPKGIGRESNGNLLLLDRDPKLGSGALRRITPVGTVASLITHVGYGTELAIDSYDTALIGGPQDIRTIAANGFEIFASWPDNLPTPGGVPRPPAGQFGNVSALAVDRDGTVYIADSTRHEVRKVTRARVMSVLAGGGVAGYADGSGTNARFNFPRGIAVDSAGSVYVVDSNPLLRKISPGGLVTSVLGVFGQPSVFGPDGLVIYRDGIGATARMALPRAVAIGPDNTVYLLDLHGLRRAFLATTSAQIVTSPSSVILTAGEPATFTVAANGYPALSYQWWRQRAGTASWEPLADDSLFAGTKSSVLSIAGVLLGMTRDQFRCVVINTLGTATSHPAQLLVDPPIVVVPLRVTTLAGRAGTEAISLDGIGAAARLNLPSGVACDASGNIYFTESGGNRVRKITASGVVSTLAGSGTAGAADGAGTNAQFSQPGAMAVDRDGNVYVADRTFSPDRSTPPTIRKISPNGVVTTVAAGFIGGPFRNISALACDRAGNLIVAANDSLVRFSPAGVGTLLPVQFVGLVTLVNLGAMAFDAADNLLIAAADFTVLKLTPKLELTRIAGRPGTPGAIDGQAANARFRGISGIAVDRTGAIYLADSGNHAIRRIDPSGIVSTVAGIKPTVAMSAPIGSTDGMGAAARFFQPTGLAIDRAGTLYVADTLNRTIRRAVPLDAVAVGESVEFSALTTEGEPVVTFAASGNASSEGTGPARAALTPPTAYQWFKDGLPLATATGARLRIETVTVAHNGRYAVAIITSEGATLSSPVDLAVRGSRLGNLSIRSGAGSGDNTLTLGFVVEGGGLPLLMRGVGPGLRAFNVTAPLPQPRLSLFSGEAPIAENSGWGNEPEVVDAALRVGAFALDGASRDAVLFTQLDPGSFTVQARSRNEDEGVVLIELYDASVGATGRSRLVNASARTHVGVGDDVMIAGFSVVGTMPRRVLIRGVGPGLEQFAVGGVLANPHLKLFDANHALVAENDNWDSGANAMEIATTASRIGAFVLADQGKDAAVLVSLPPGSYTAHLSGAAETQGLGLIEIYEVP